MSLWTTVVETGLCSIVSWTLSFRYFGWKFCDCEHISMLAFSSEHCCAQFQLHRAVTMVVGSLSCYRAVTY